MPKSDPSDGQSVLIQKLKHACTSYDTAAKKYLTAVKGLDGAMEAIAIAIRELAQGEENAAVRTRADSLCTAVDRHMATNSVTGGSGGGASKSRRVSEVPAGGLGGGGGDTYSFVSYMNDFTREISAAIEELKTTIKVTEKAKANNDAIISKFNKQRSEVDSLETKLAKKNQGVVNNPKFAEKVAKRDKLRVEVDTNTEKFRASYAALLQKRSQTLQRVVDGVQTYSVKYYTNLSKTMQA